MATAPRIVSLLPAATELACVLGLESQLVGISFECNYPPSIIHLPRVVTTALDTQTMTPAEIDAAVSAHMRQGKDLYVIDEEQLKALRPDIILTQDLCRVCAPSGNELSQALATLDYQPEVIFMSPHTLSDIEDNLRALAKATGKTGEAETIIAGWHTRRRAVESRAQSLTRRPRVAVMEWVDPIYCAGHWLAEMIELAGGDDPLARKGEDSVRVDWPTIAKSQPEVVIVAPCGYNQRQAEQQLANLTTLPGWNDLPAVRSKRVHAVDADAYFVRPGPRVIEGMEILSELFADAA